MCTLDGKVVGQHDGIMYYTIGQRHGLGIGGPGEAWFVVGKNAQKNELIVGQGDQQEMLYANRVILTDVNIINNDISEGEHITAKFRYRQPDVGITVHFLNDNKVEVITDTPTKAITPGQACVFYRGEYCLGSGIIDEVYMNEVKRNY
jgi:tRNA-specific 2-thiouridylase